MSKPNKINQKPLIWGTIASISLLLIYFTILSLANSAEHAFQQFIDLWYWMLPLIIGFGVQVGLFVYMRTTLKERSKEGIMSVTAAGGVSTTSMIACCAHHVVDVLPILGLTAAAMFLAQFQNLFLVIGVVSNLIGINIMLKIIQEHKLFSKSTLLGKIMQINMKKLLYANLITGILLITITVILTV